jgi:hypothetical protein
MRSRLSLILVALTMLFAFVATGCGGDKQPDTVEAVPSGATQSTSKDSAGSVNPATPPTKKSLDSTGDVSAKIDEAMREARAQCKKAAKSIPDGEAKTNALEACAKIK